MNFQSIIIILIVIAAAVTALIVYCKGGRGCSCSGKDCDGCCTSCNSKCSSGKK